MTKWLLSLAMALTYTLVMVILTGSDIVAEFQGWHIVMALIPGAMFSFIAAYIVLDRL